MPENEDVDQRVSHKPRATHPTSRLTFFEALHSFLKGSRYRMI